MDGVELLMMDAIKLPQKLLQFITITYSKYCLVNKILDRYLLLPFIHSIALDVSAITPRVIHSTINLRYYSFYTGSASNPYHPQSTGLDYKKQIMIICTYTQYAYKYMQFEFAQQLQAT